MFCGITSIMASRRFGTQLQAAYSELLEQLQQAELDDLASYEGSFGAKTVKGSRYWYFRRRAGEKLEERYIGRESHELLERIEQLKPRVADAKAAAAGRRELIRQMRAGGYLTPDRRTGRVLEELSRAGVFRLASVLVETHAFRCYGAMLGCRLQAQDATTSDIDIAHDPTVSVAISDSTDPHVAAALATAKRFVPIPGLNPGRAISSWQTSDRQLRVELLTPEIGKPGSSSVRLKALGAFAQPLRFLDYLLAETQPAAVLTGSGVLVTVPVPERYALHKLIVAQRRERSEQEKSQKDLAQSESLLRVLLEDRPGDVKDAWSNLVSRGAAWKRDATRSLQHLPKELRQVFV